MRKLFAALSMADTIERDREDDVATDRTVDPLSALMERYAAGEDEVFERLYQLLAPRLYRFCRRLAAHQSEADDDFQETLLRLHRARATYAAGANALYWAFAIARSVYLDRLRYRRRRPEDLGVANDAAENDYLLADEHSSPESHAHASDLVQVVTDELNRMSAKKRAAYVLVREEGLGMKDAAALLGTTVDAVKQRVHRASEQLREALDAAGWQEQGATEPTRESSPGEALDLLA